MDLTIKLDTLTPEALDKLMDLISEVQASAPIPTAEAPVLTTDPAEPEIWDTETVCYKMGLTRAGIAYGLRAGILPKPFTRPRQVRKWLAEDWREWQRQNSKAKYNTMAKEPVA